MNSTCFSMDFMVELSIFGDRVQIRKVSVLADPGRVCRAAHAKSGFPLSSSSIYLAYPGRGHIF